jgi:hypothetical protein
MFDPAPTFETDATALPFSFSLYTIAFAFFSGTAVAGYQRLSRDISNFLTLPLTGKTSLSLAAISFGTELLTRSSSTTTFVFWRKGSGSVTKKTALVTAIGKLVFSPKT